MGFSMASMFKAILLIVNAFTVLSEKRFLSKCMYLKLYLCLMVVQAWFNSVAGI